MLTKVRPGRFGFTGFELLIVIALVGLLAWLVVSRFGDLATEARNTERRLDISIVAAELEAFHAGQGYYPAYTSALPIALQISPDGQQQISPDTIALIDPDGSFIQDSPTASTNPPATGYDPTARPEGSQYTYAPYGCSVADATEAANGETEEATEVDETNAEAENNDGTDEETIEVDETSDAENFSSCQNYVLYAWLENDFTYSKVSNN